MSVYNGQAPHCWEGYNEDLGGGFIEVSAKDDMGITDIFKLLLEQVKTPRVKHTDRFLLRRSFSCLTKNKQKFTKQHNRLLI
jgi:hypothetical protein